MQPYLSNAPRGSLLISVSTCICFILFSMACRLVCSALDLLIHKSSTNLDTPRRAKCIYSGDIVFTISKYLKQLSHDGPFTL